MNTAVDKLTKTRLDSVVADLAKGEQKWASTTLKQRVELLRRTRATVADQAEAWVETACRIKLLDPDSPYAGEEWTAGPFAILWGLDALAGTLEKVARGRRPLDDVRLKRAPGGRVAVPVLPRTVKDRVAFSGFQGRVWMRPGLDEATVRRTAGLGALDPTSSGGIGLVLGAGNVTSIAPLDVLYELVAHNRVVLLKVNPILDDLTPILEQALSPLVEHGVLRIIGGGGDVGGYLAHHPGISHIHITGSINTLDLIAFGPGEEGRARKAAGTPVLDKPITSELGGVAPVIVVPGEWSDSDLRYQAENVVTQRLHNSGHNCNGSQVVLLSSDWPQREAFLNEIRRVLAEAPARQPWYPGAADRLADLAGASSGDRLGPGADRLLIDLDAGDPASFQVTEAFATALGVRSLPGTGADFVASAVEFANVQLFGTLSATVLIDPGTERGLGSPLEEFIAPLRYGNIGINSWTVLGFADPYATWGAFPGHTLNDAKSGIGIVHNGYLLDGVERTVFRGSFRPFPRSVLRGEASLSPKPLWFVTNRNAAVIGRRLARYGVNPTWARLMGVAAAAMRG